MVKRQRVGVAWCSLRAILKADDTSIKYGRPARAFTDRPPGLL
jgi:hypothetical protein